MKYIKKYKFFESLDEQSIENILNIEIDIYKKYLIDNHGGVGGSNITFNSEERAFEESEGEWVSMFSYYMYGPKNNSISNPRISGTCQATYSMKSKENIYLLICICIQKY